MTGNKPFELGVTIGRFQTFHAGHQDMMDIALSLCERVAVFIGSSQEQGTEKNPFSYELRRDMIRDVYGDRLEIYPLPDIGVGNNGRWGEYVLENVVERCGKLPDLMISGKENRRTDWLENENGQKTAELFIPKTIDISASAMRRFLLEGDLENWKKYVDPALEGRFSQLKELTEASRSNKETQSL